MGNVNIFSFEISYFEREGSRYITAQLCSTPHLTARAPPPVAGIHGRLCCPVCARLPPPLASHVVDKLRPPSTPAAGRPPASSSLDPSHRAQRGVLPLEARPHWPGSLPPGAPKLQCLQVASTPCTQSVRGNASSSEMQKFISMVHRTFVLVIRMLV